MIHAIVRPPGKTFADGLTTARLGVPDYPLAVLQHQAYCRALEQCGVILTRLAPVELHPDAAFVEDAAVITPAGIVFTRPGAVERLGEVFVLEEELREFPGPRMRIEPPGTLDGGDVCHAGTDWFIGISQRTNEAGARQFADLLERQGYRSRLIDIRGRGDLLHLKSGLAFPDEGRLIAAEGLLDREQGKGYEIIPVHPSELYASNCISLNGRILLAAGFPDLEGRLRGLGYDLILLEMSEFRKMDGGLSCLSLRFEEGSFQGPER